MNDQQLLDPVTGRPIEGVVTEITKAEVLVDPVTGLPIEGVVTEITKAAAAAAVAEKTDVEFFLDWSQRWVFESVYPIMGGVVNEGIAKLEGEGFTNKEARYWLEALTILQLIRIGYPIPPFRHRYWVPDPVVYTEREIMAMIAKGETIPAVEYTGFEGTR